MKKLLFIAVLLSACQQERTCELTITQQDHEYLICKDSVIHSKDCKNFQHKAEKK